MARVRNTACVGTILLLAAGAANAAVFCANTPAELVANLATAQANGSDDEVRIAAGSYALTSAPVYSSSEDHSIEVSGGWNAACGTQNAGTTVLNGQGEVRTLAVSQNSTSTAATISVHDLTLADGFTTGTTVTTVNGGALYVFGRSGAITIERNVMFGSRADQYGGGVSVSSAGPLLVRSNLVFGNTADYGGASFDTFDPNFYVSGNTIMSNTALANDSVGGLHLSGGLQGAVWISNNIVWNNTANGALDMLVIGPNARLYNDIGTAGGTAPDALSQGNLSVDPQLVPCSGFLCFNFRLRRSSPLVDTGYNSPPGGVGNFDLDGARRVVGPYVDIGAYELDRLFANGFE